MLGKRILLPQEVPELEQSLASFVYILMASPIWTALSVLPLGLPQSLWFLPHCSEFEFPAQSYPEELPHTPIAVSLVYRLSYFE